MATLLHEGASKWEQGDKLHESHKNETPQKAGIRQRPGPISCAIRVICLPALFWASSLFAGNLIQHAPQIDVAHLPEKRDGYPLLAATSQRKQLHSLPYISPLPWSAQPGKTPIDWKSASKSHKHYFSKITPELMMKKTMQKTKKTPTFFCSIKYYLYLCIAFERKTFFVSSVG